MTQVNFYDPLFEPASMLTYSIIAARFKGKWIYVRHRDRKTYEIPAGHIEKGETSLEAACRELMEETGAIRYEIDCVATYSVIRDENTGWGRLYFAEVSELGAISDIFEIAERILLDQLPENLTYPDIQADFYEKVLEYLRLKIK